MEGRRLCRRVSPGEAGQTVGHLLKSAYRMPAGMIASLKFREDGIRLNGERARTSALLCAGDTLSVRLDEPGALNPAAPVPLPLRLVYEDLDLALLDKPAGLVVHGTAEGAPTLLNALAARWGREQPVYPVHRLDRSTSGLLAVAKNPYAAERLRRALHTESFVRDYLAVVSGRPPEDNGVIDAPISPAADARGRYSVSAQGREARSEYALLASAGGVSLLRLRLDTGRTHQIRVHLSALGCPLWGDLRYGGPADVLLGRPALHAAHLRLIQPVTGETLDASSALPEDLRAFLLSKGIETKDWEEKLPWRL